MNIKVLFAIGNPSTPQYSLTKHNVGKAFIQKYLLNLNEKYKVKRQNKQVKYTSYQINSNLIVCTSNTYMNLSGTALSSFISKNRNINTSNIIIIHDDLQHKIGNAKIKKQGSAQGHNGVASIIKQLKHSKIKRLQIGIGRPSCRDPLIISNYVLSKFSPNQMGAINQSFKKCLTLLEKQNFV